MSNANTAITITGISIVPNTNTVNLTYSTGTNADKNNGNVSEKTGQGQATITYTSGQPGWMVYGSYVNGVVPPDISLSTALVIVDDPNNKTAEQLNFCIQVRDSNGNIYTSADPVITNEPN